ncbi:hypothetical protein J7M22_08190 [Candidatus Poribacteria bacterium]|nr:hypothetical protein [Candidatus Poribacteria bacterium]
MRGKKIGYYGYPPRDALDKQRERFSGDPVDLDVDLGAPDFGVIPEVYCHIIRNIVNNALHLKDQLGVIVAAVGEDKCDQGRFAAKILKDMGFEVVEVRNHNMRRLRPLRIATSNLPLREKVERIMDLIQADDEREYVQCKPTHGFWGVPPHDMRLLELFPNTTHVYGWTRAVEYGTPADLEAEMEVDPDVPTVFYAQSFCAKNALAKYLAEKYDGLYIDVHGKLTNSVIAKVEAFIRLNWDVKHKT